MLNCIVIEDQSPAQRILRKFIGEHPDLNLLEVFSDAYAASDYLGKQSVDLMFLDIHLPRMSGIEFLKSQPDHAMVIMTTAFPDYALESYEYNVIDYLLKPFLKERFDQSIAKALSVKGLANNNGKQQSEENIVIKSGYEIIKVPVRSIVFIHSDADYTEIVCLESTYLSAESLRYWKETLNNRFYQVHKSYIVSLSHVERIFQNKIYLTGDRVVPVGRTYKKEFIDAYVHSGSDQ